MEKKYHQECRNTKSRKSSNKICKFNFFFKYFNKMLSIILTRLEIFLIVLSLNLNQDLFQFKKAILNDDQLNLVILQSIKHSTKSYRIGT